ncbi:MAG: hypothetical protein AB8B69_20755, partial [Chitinophagales bacterium]
MDFIYDYYIYLPSTNDCQNGIMGAETITNFSIDIEITNNCLGSSFLDYALEKFTIQTDGMVGVTKNHTTPVSQTLNLSYGHPNNPDGDFFAFTPAFTDLDATIVNPFTDCEENISSCAQGESVWIAYAIPIGGCPPYTTQQWQYRETPTSAWKNACPFASDLYSSSSKTYLGTIAAIPSYDYKYILSDSSNPPVQIEKETDFENFDEFIENISTTSSNDNCQSTVTVDFFSFYDYYNSPYEVSISYNGGLEFSSTKNNIGETVSFNVPFSGDYTIEAKDGVSGCTEKAIVSVQPQTPLSQIPSFIRYCDLPITINAGDPNANYVWKLRKRNLDINGNCGTNIGAEIELPNLEETIVLDDSLIEPNFCYRLIMTATDPISLCNTSDNTNILPSKLNSPNADLGLDMNVDYCETELPIIIQPINTTPNQIYMWSSGQTTQSIAIEQPDTYTLTVSNADGCTATDQVTVSLFTGILISLEEEIAACQGDVIILDPIISKAASANGDFSYIWSTGETTENIAVTNTGVYGLTVSNQDVCIDTDEITVYFTKYPQALNWQEDVFVCGESSVILDATVTPSVSYEWSTNETTPSIEVTETGVYQVSVTNIFIPDYQECTITEEVSVTFGDVTAEIEFEIEGCSTGNTTLSTEENPNFMYRWNTGSNQASIDITQAGTYTVTVTAGNCSVIDEITVDNSSIGTQTAYTLQADEEWTTIRNIDGLVIVPFGVKLNIVNTTIHFMDRASGILVEEGGYLQVDNTVLRGNPCTSIPWKGIQVEGQHATAQPAGYTTNGSPHHGTVIVRNGSTIQDASTGILVRSIGTSLGGGILSVRNSNFTNNRISILMDATGVGTNLRGSIWENNFTNNAPFVGGSGGDYTHIYLNRLGSHFNIFGNTFTSNGIANVTSVYTLSSTTLCVNNTFENVYKGIDAYNTSGIPDVRINGNDFVNTYKGITL